MTAPGTSHAAQRATLVTVLAWVTMACSGLLLPISFISLLMLVAGSDGSGTATFTGVFTVVLLPPLAFVAGIGLLLRQRWAWLFLLVLLVALLAEQLAVQVAELATPPGPPVTTVSPDGLRTTTFSSADPLAMPLAIACVLGLFALLTPGVRNDCHANLAAARAALRDRTLTFRGLPAGEVGASMAQDGWRVAHRGRDGMVYEERHGGTWQHIDIDGELLMGRAHHVIYFASPERWREYPAWARDRRDEIIGRITSAFRAPDYEYSGLDTTAGAGRAASAASGDNLAPSAAAATAQGAWVNEHTSRIAGTARELRALAIAVALLLALAAVAAWMVLHGIQTGDTWQPGARASQWHAVARADSPLSFWASIAIYAVVGIASLVFALLGVRVLLAGRTAR